MRFRRYLESKIGHCIPEEIKAPSGFHLVGHVALLHTEITDRECLKLLAKATLDFDHRIRSVAVRTGPTVGDFRVPQYRLIGGSSDTVTDHVERGIVFRLDPLRVTFSGGNKLERVSIADQAKHGEHIVDMFACVGQFALHIARREGVYVTAIELNPVAHAFLVQNISINGFRNVTPILGDCRTVRLEKAADRVVMGYLHDTVGFLPAAFHILKEEGGCIHMHTSIPAQETIDVKRQIELVAESKGFTASVKHRRVKGYSPGINHYMFDIQAR